VFLADYADPVTIMERSVAFRAHSRDNGDSDLTKTISA